MTSPAAHPAYRADIDGLRAVAVLAVVVFHAFPGLLRGGFVGVDVFFVISGYLISTIILGNIERRSFRISEFYSRRARRIFPALATMLAACLVLGWFVLLPGEYGSLGKHVAGGVGFVSNLVLLGEAGYFDVSAASKPLLHLWSLGIEEQFYLVWPLLLMVVRSRRRGLVLIAAVLVGSFVLDLVVLRHQPSTAFYSPLTRFWELVIGSALAWIGLFAPRHLLAQRPRLATAASIVGAGLVLGAARFFDEEQPFPGWRALAPTVGAFLVISAGPGAWLNRYVLARPLLVWVGLISFPLYLWHWPLLAYARIVAGQTPPATIRLVAVVLAFVLAWLTYRFVERPVRASTRTGRTVTVLVSAMGVVLAAGLVLVAREGFAKERGPWNVTNLGVPDGRAEQWTDACRPTRDRLYSPAFDPALDFCHGTGDLAATRFDVVVVGDSHAGRLYSGLRATSSLTLLDLGRGSCLPLYGYEAANVGSSRSFACTPTMATVLDAATTSTRRTLLLSGFFARPYDGRVVAAPGVDVAATMRATFARLAAGAPHVLIVLDVPELPFDPSRCVDRPYARSTTRGRCAFDRAAVDAARQLYEPDVRRAAEGLANVTIFDPTPVLCDATQCHAVDDGKLLYDDRHHLSRDGAALVARALAHEL